MTGITRSTADLDPRQKRILFRAWHRGTREMDLLMGRYVESVIDRLSDDEIENLETLIEADDRDLFAWLVEGVPVPPEHDTPLFAAMKAFHDHKKPLDL